MNHIPILPADRGKENMVYFAADGSTMRNMGRKEVHFMNRGSDDVVPTELQVTGVQKPLAVVRRIVKKCSKIMVVGENGCSCIEGANGKRAIMNEKCSIYTLPVKYQ